MFLTSILFSQSNTISTDSIKKYFEETKIATNKYQEFWDLDLYGPILIVNPSSKEVYANLPDTFGILKAENGIYKGTLPKGILVGNISTEWGGRTWAMIMSIFISDSKRDRIDLFSHELFHRVQSELGFKRINDGNNQHLDSENGRIFLRLELNALLRSLKVTNEEKANYHILNALKFRNYRYQLFSNAYVSESTIEINEGVASYTGKVHRGLNHHEVFELMQVKISEFLKQPSYVQLFAYQTIPCYGFVLARKNKYWNKKVTSKTNLTDYMNNIFSYKKSNLDEMYINSIGKEYGIDTIKLQEIKRSQLIQKKIKEYKTKFLKQSHFTIPFEKKRVYYDTRYIVTIENFGFVYPTFKATDNWGDLEVNDVGGLLNQDRSSVTITLPTTINKDKINGDGWTLNLKKGYELSKDEESGNYLLKKIKE